MLKLTNQLIKTTIYKYSFGDTDPYLNYFDRNCDLVYVDKFIITRHLLDSFPIFREEWGEEDDIETIKTGYFDLKLSRIMQERSESGKSIVEFFEHVSEVAAEYKYVIVCESENPIRNYSGVIDVGSLTIGDDTVGNEYHISVSVIGIDTEFIDLLKRSTLTKILSDQSFDSDYLRTLFYWADPSKLSVQSQLNLNLKLGYDLKVDKSLLDRLWNANLDYSNTYCIITNWQAFRSFLKGYGFKFKIIFAGHTAAGPSFLIKLFYRSDGIHESAATKVLHPSRGLMKTGVDWIGLFFTHRPDGENSELEHFTGLIMGRDKTIITNADQDFIYNNKEKTYRLGNFVILEDVIHKFDMEHFNANLTAGDVSICRLVPGQDINPLLTYLSNTELRYYLTSAKKKIVGDILVGDNDEFTLGSKVNINGDSYVVDRITEFNAHSQTMKAEFVQA